MFKVGQYYRDGTWIVGRAPASVLTIGKCKKPGHRVRRFVCPRRHAKLVVDSLYVEVIREVQGCASRARANGISLFSS